MKNTVRWMKQTAYTGMGISLLVAMSFVSSATADRLTSPNYIINGNLGGSFGGSLSSSNYKMSAIGGETVVGAGAGGSYIIDQQPGSDPITPSMSLTVQPSGLVGYYPMDEVSGTTTADSSRYQNDGTLQSTAAFTAAGKIGGAVNINGPNTTATNGTGSVNVPNSAVLPSGQQMTVEMWLNLPAALPSNASKFIMTHSTGSSGKSWQLAMVNSTLYFYVATSPTDTSTSVGCSNCFSSYGTWRHVVLVFDGTQTTPANRAAIYLDGVKSNNYAGGTMPTTLQSTTAKLAIGSSDGTGLAWPGSIDQVKVFNRALSAGEIAAEYNAQNAGVPTGFSIQSQYGGSSTSAYDAVVRSNAAYSLSVQEDHDLQSGANTITPVSGSIASPAAWTEGVTRGFGFTLTAAPSLDGKWGSGGMYAALPTTATSIYSGAGSTGGTPDVISLQLRLHAIDSQPYGAYTNSVTYTGTTTP